MGLFTLIRDLTGNTSRIEVFSASVGNQVFLVRRLCLVALATAVGFRPRLWQTPLHYSGWGLKLRSGQRSEARQHILQPIKSNTPSIGTWELMWGASLRLTDSCLKKINVVEGWILHLELRCKS